MGRNMVGSLRFFLRESPFRECSTIPHFNFKRNFIGRETLSLFIQVNPSIIIVIFVSKPSSEVDSTEIESISWAQILITYYQNHRNLRCSESR